MILKEILQTKKRISAQENKSLAAIRREL